MPETSLKSKETGYEPENNFNDTESRDENTSSHYSAFSRSVLSKQKKNNFDKSLKRKRRSTITGNHEFLQTLIGRRSGEKDLNQMTGKSNKKPEYKQEMSKGKRKLDLAIIEENMEIKDVDDLDMEESQHDDFMSHFVEDLDQSDGSDKDK